MSSDNNAESSPLVSSLNDKRKYIVDFSMKCPIGWSTYNEVRQDSSISLSDPGAKNREKKMCFFV